MPRAPSPGSVSPSAERFWVTRYSGTCDAAAPGVRRNALPGHKKVGIGEGTALLRPLQTRTLPGLASRQSEVHLNLCFHCHRLAVQHVGLVAPLLHSFNR